MITLNRAFWDRLSFIFANIAQVALAGMFVPFFVGVTNLTVAVLGLVAALLLWIISLWIAKLKL